MARWLFALLIFFALAPAGVHADEAAPDAPAQAPTRSPTQEPVAPARVALEGVPTHVAPGHGANEILIAFQDGAIARHRLGTGETWRRTPSSDACHALVATAEGLLCATETKLRHVDAEGTVRWETDRPVTFAVDRTGTKVVAITAKSQLVELNLATGEVLATRKVGDGRTVERATLDMGSGLAVLGVSDG